MCLQVLQYTMKNNKRKEQTLVNNMSVNVLVCIINHPGINALKISKKTRIPQASVYRALSALIDTGFLDTTTQKSGKNGGNSTIMFASKKKRFQITIDSKGVRVY